MAGFLTALLKGENLITAGKYAMLAGRDNLHGSDAISGLREWADMEKSIREKY